MLLLCSCAEPPNKEMDQAQAAIEAARAAGAEQDATEEFSAALTALKQSRDAVAQRDYRSALNYALDSRERAQNAEKQALDRRAAIRGDFDRELKNLTALLDGAEKRIAAADSNRVPRRTINQVKSALAAARRTVQQSAASAERGDYAAAQRELTAVRARVTAAIAELDATDKKGQRAKGKGQR